jgi:hypothetical protein
MIDEICQWALYSSSYLHFGSEVAQAQAGYHSSQAESTVLPFKLQRPSQLA